MSSINRVKAILTTPGSEWLRIEPEPSTVSSICRDWLVWLAAIPAIAAFVGHSLIGYSMMGVTTRAPILAGLAQAVVDLVLAVAMVWLVARGAAVLAPRFGGRSSFLSAFKLIAYGTTASMVAGVICLVPPLSTLSLLGGLHAIWVIRLGAPVLMKVPDGRAWGYTAVLIMGAGVAGLLLDAVASVLPSPHGIANAAVVRLATPLGEVSVDPKKFDDHLHKFAEVARNLEEAEKAMRRASESGDRAGTTQATGTAFDALTGAGLRLAVDVRILKKAFPEAIGNLPRGQLETVNTWLMGIPAVRVSAEYGSGGRRLMLEVVDVGSLSNVIAPADLAGAERARGMHEASKRTFRDGARTIHESEDKNSSRRRYRMVLANGVVVQAEGSDVTMSELKRAVELIDLLALERAGNS